MSTDNKKEDPEKNRNPPKKDKKKEDSQNTQKADVESEDHGGLPARDLKKNLGCGG